jgi:glycosyltransferase involved in cell wall biosynthesis
MSRFPLLSETFILREMVEVEHQGQEIVMYPLICQHQPVVHEDAKKWNSRVNCIPFFSYKILAENIRTFFRIPLRYITLVWRVFKENLSSFDFLTKSLYLFPKAVYTAKQLQKKDIEHIHAHYATHPALGAWIIHNLTGISYSITVHAHDIYDCQAMLGTKLKSATFLAPISKYNIDFMAEHVGEWVREKCHVIHCGVDPTNYSNVHPNANQDGIFEILQIGSLHWKKGQVYLIKAIAHLRDQGVPVRLRIIGEGDERTILEKEIERHQLESIVELMGAKTQDEVAKLLPTADCYVQSSVSEGIPVAIMEAMACELPVVATDITGIPELVLSGETGMLVPPKDIEALSNALQFIKENPELAKQMGKRGRIWVQENFDLTKNVAKLISLFKEHRGV